jgi:hypothetical protein
MQRKKLVMNNFCLRQFVGHKNELVIPMDVGKFTEKLNDLYLGSDSVLRPGYAEFCKHLIVENFTDAPVYYAKISDENKLFLESDYVARTDYELPVLKRFFKKENVKSGKAKFLDVILYSRTQIELEEKSIDAKQNAHSEEDYDWGIISIKPQDEDFEIMMDPITMMRNSLGPSEGGSGVQLDREKYQQSVAFWSKNAVIL